MTSDPQLRFWLLRFNELYYGGELPTDRIAVWWEPCGKDAATTRLEDEDEYVIRVDPSLTGLLRHAKKDLLHEMAHVKLWPFRKLKDHGKRFDAEIQRLCGFRSYRRLL